MFDPIQERQNLVNSRPMTWGFGLSAIGLALLSVDSGLELAFILSFAPELRKLLVHPVWYLGVGGTITMLTFLGAYLIWLRIPTSAWARASTLLMIMNLGHVVLWLVEHHPELGLPDQRMQHRWLRVQVSQVMNWTEFLCWIVLFRELVKEARASADVELVDRSFRVYPGFVWLGTVVAVAVAAGLTDWSAGWPLRRVVLKPLDSLMLATLTTMLTFAASLQMTVLCVRASYLAGAMSRRRTDAAESMQWTHDEWDDDPWGTKDVALENRFR